MVPSHGPPVSGQLAADLRVNLAGTLSKYSERGQACVDTLSGIIRTNKLGASDDAILQDQARVLIVGAEDIADKTVVEREIEHLRASSEIGRIIAFMQIEPVSH